MAGSINFVLGTDAQILALTPESENWIDRAFYYPSDKNYFYQALNDEMKKYGEGDNESIGEGIRLNEKIIGGVKTLIEENDTLDIPENWDYNTFKLDIDGVINCSGQINIL